MIDETTTLAATDVSVQKMPAPLADASFIVADNDPSDPVGVISDDAGSDDFI
jgi:hypothetical protein